MFYDIRYKNNVEYYFVYHVSLFSDFDKMGSFLFIFQKEGLKPCPIQYYVAVTQKSILGKFM
ncbi:hypothetical protein AM305_03153 [Actinobacillus minor NM305]|uniref:Uncharacterized protein n=1 Tax=Actinobacillus minor NM305 TaxID=637911 RepID=C5S4T7_9PAST|nr:hypothetical protein AM305_03153 [Actinobacillus minor NM305]